MSDEFNQEQRDYVRYRHKQRTDTGQCRVDHDDWPCHTMQLLEAYEEMARLAQVRLHRLLNLIPTPEEPWAAEARIRWENAPDDQ